MRAAVLADSGRKVGLGHLTRCLALAQAMKRYHHVSPAFICHDADVRKWISREGFKTVSASEKKWDILITDSYRLHTGQLRRLRAMTKTLLTIDDLGHVKVPSDWVLNSSINAQKTGYANARAEGFLLGPKFHPLREDFSNHRVAKKQKSSIENVVVLLGGGYHEELLEKLIPLTLTLLPHTRLHVVIGPYYKTSLKGFSSRVRFHQSPKDLRELLRSCDMAISGAGQSLFELAFIGLPIVALLLADNQRENLAGFQKKGVILSAGSPRDRQFAERFKQCVRQLSENRVRRVQMSKSGQALVDGGGARRVVDLLFKENSYAKN